LARVLRAARAIRLGKVLFRSETVRRTLSEAFASISAILNLLAMLAYVMFIFAVMGIHLFWHCHEHCHGDHCVYTRGHFGALLPAFLSLYQLFSRDNWASIMYEYQECMGTMSVALYFDTVFVVCNFVLLPVFVSIFLDNFSLSEEQKRNKQVALYVKSTMQRSKGINVLDVKYINHAVGILYKGTKVLKRKETEFRNLENQTGELLSVDVATTGTDRPVASFEEEIEPESFERYKIGEKAIAPEDTQDFSLNIFAPDHTFRLLLRNVAESGVFNYLILVAIAASGVSMALEGPEGHKNAGKVDELLLFAEYTIYF
jgi:hypothetical protein